MDTMSISATLRDPSCWISPSHTFLAVAAETPWQTVGYRHPRTIRYLTVWDVPHGLFSVVGRGRASAQSSLAGSQLTVHSIVTCSAHHSHRELCWLRLGLISPKPLPLPPARDRRLAAA